MVLTSVCCSRRGRSEPGNISPPSNFPAFHRPSAFAGGRFHVQCRNADHPSQLRVRLARDPIRVPHRHQPAPQRAVEEREVPRGQGGLRRHGRKRPGRGGQAQVGGGRDALRHRPPAARHAHEGRQGRGWQGHRPEVCLGGRVRRLARDVRQDGRQVRRRGGEHRRPHACLHRDGRPEPEQARLLPEAARAGRLGEPSPGRGGRAEDEAGHADGHAAHRHQVAPLWRQAAA